MNMPLNGASAEQQQVQVNPIELAQIALMFLGRVDFKRHERAQFDLVEAMLQAIAGGGVRLVGTREVQQSLPLDVPPAPESPPPAH